MKALLSILALVTCFNSILFSQTDVLTPLEIAKIKYVNRAVMSPDGDLIAYTVSHPADPLKENKTAESHLYVWNLEQSISTPFYTQGSVGSVAFRPGKASITFLTKKNGDNTRSLYEMGLSGGEAVKLFEHETNISHYEWSADGSRLLFRAAEKNEKPKSKLPYEPEIYEEDLTYSRVFAVDPNEWKPTKINIEGDAHGMKWSPDGSKIAIATSPTPLIDDYYMRQTINILDAKSFDVLGTVDHSAKLGMFEWSPDGSQLGFIAGAHINDPIDGRFFVVDGQGGKPRNVNPNLEGKFETFQWKDDKTVTYLASKGVASELGELDIKKGSMSSVLSGTEPVITDFHRLDDGSIACIANASTHPSELFVKEKKDPSLKRLTNSNPWLKNIKMGKQEVITYKARDGVEIEGILIRPADEQKDQKDPLITVVHGGPEAHYDNGWLTAYSMPGQLAAGSGYAVFYPNYRGSTGRGLEFAMSSQGDLAGKEFDDIVDGVDYLIESGLVNKDKVGVTGGSYGGYATGWMATKYSDRFAAGVMFVGISNNISKWGTSDIPEELYQVHARKRIGDDYNKWLERSPIYHVDNAKTPLLIMHGKNDTRVYPGQSMELYRHIKTRTDTPVRLVFYPGEGHGNRNSTARFDYNIRMMRWFDNFLKDEEIELNTSIELPEN